MEPEPRVVPHPGTILAFASAVALLLGGALAACGGDDTGPAAADGGGAGDGGPAEIAGRDAPPGDVRPDAGPTVAYEPHTPLVIPTEVDADGAADIADPHVVKDGATWYLYATQSKRDFAVWLSEDLATWRRGGTVWAPTPGTWNADGQAWAPHVERTDEGWFLYYTAGQRIGVARADGPLGPFVEVLDHELVGGGHGGVGDGVFEHRDDPPEDNADRPWDMDPMDFEEYAIDAFVLTTSDGQRVLYFTAYTPLSVIHAIPMVDWVTLADEPPQPVLAPAPTTWEGVVAEGVWVEERAGRFHLTYSGNHAISQHYALGAAVGPTPFGPFEKRADNPFLRSDPAAAFWAPGHHSIAAGARGDRLLFYHTKTAPEQGYDRRIRYAPVRWGEAADGTETLVFTAPPP